MGRRLHRCHLLAMSLCQARCSWGWWSWWWREFNIWQCLMCNAANSSKDDFKAVPTVIYNVLSQQTNFFMIIMAMKKKKMMMMMKKNVVMMVMMKKKKAMKRMHNLQRSLYLAAHLNCQLLQKRNETNKSLWAGDAGDDDDGGGDDDHHGGCHDGDGVFGHDDNGEVLKGDHGLWGTEGRCRLFSCPYDQVWLIWWAGHIEL